MRSSLVKWGVGARFAAKGAIVGLVLPSILLAAQGYEPIASIRLGGYSLDYWCWQLLLTLTPPSLLLVAAGSGSEGSVWWSAVVAVLALNSIIYAALTWFLFVAARKGKRYLLVSAALLAVTLVSSEAMYLPRWILGLVESPDDGLLAALARMHGPLVSLVLAAITIVLALLYLVFGRNRELDPSSGERQSETNLDRRNL